MKRFAFKLLVFLLLGAIINVAVAWGCAGLVKPKQMKQLSGFFPPMEWRAIGIRHLTVIAFANDESSHKIEFLYEAGWPLFSMARRTVNYSSAQLIQFVPPREYRLLRPLWPGFAINTIFYAAVAWMLFTVPGYIKRRRRIKRGLCARCAYPLRGSAVCSECGTAADSR